MWRSETFWDQTRVLLLHDRHYDPLGSLNSTVLPLNFKLTGVASCVARRTLTRAGENKVLSAMEAWGSSEVVSSSGLLLVSSLTDSLQLLDSSDAI